MAVLVGLVETTAARRRHQPHPGASRTRPESMLSAAAKSRRQEGALGGVAATIAGSNEQAIAAQTSEISWSYLAKPNGIFDAKMRSKGH